MTLMKEERRHNRRLASLRLRGGKKAGSELK
jgi:hypothetical protein